MGKVTKKCQVGTELKHFRTLVDIVDNVDYFINFL